MIRTQQFTSLNQSLIQCLIQVCSYAHDSRLMVDNKKLIKKFIRFVGKLICLLEKKN